jgi:hypothetical protein
VVKDGQDVQKKEIVVNDPLLYSGVRFYQASYGKTGKVDKFCWSRLRATVLAETGNRFGAERRSSTRSDTTVRFAEFFPDYAVRDGQVYRNRTNWKIRQLTLVVTSKAAGKDFDVWFPPIDEVADNSKSPWQFQATDLKDGPLHRPAGFARTGTVGRLVGRSADGRWTGIRVLRGAHAVLGGAGSRSRRRQTVRFGSGELRTAIATRLSSASKIWWSWSKRN